jgi:hypothetical protein
LVRFVDVGQLVRFAFGQDHSWSGSQLAKFAIGQVVDVGQVRSWSG